MKEGSHIWSLYMAWLAFPRFPNLEAGYLCSRLIENIRAAFSTNQVQNLNQSWLGLPAFSAPRANVRDSLKKLVSPIQPIRNKT